MNQLARSFEAREDAKGLFVKGIMPKDDTFVSGRVIPQMKSGSVSDMSIGFMIKDYDIKEGVRYLKEVSLLETSLVTIPMNPEANVTGFKNAVSYQDLPLADRDCAWDASAAVARVRDFTDSEDGPSRAYRRAFLYFDNEKL